MPCFFLRAAKTGQTDQDDFSDSALSVSFIVHKLKSTEHTLCKYFDFVLISEWSLINIPGTMGAGPNKLLVVKGLKCKSPDCFLLTFWCEFVTNLYPK